MELKTYLKTQKTRIDRFLESYQHPLDVPERLKEAMQYSISAGGKRLRPILVLAAHDAVGGTSPAAVAVGAAIELIHTYSLIHDDLPAMDNDDFRRGKPTNHKVYGEAMAILAGDGLLTQAFEILSDPVLMAEVPAGILTRITAEVARGAGSGGMVGGQVLDMLSEGTEIDGTSLQNMHMRKTGALIRASALAGALLGGADPRQVEALGHYGTRVGLAFQVADDILDVTQTEEQLGKSTSDVARGKRTYPSIYGLETARIMAGGLVREALESLESFGDEAEPLREIARYIVSRSH